MNRNVRMALYGLTAAAFLLAVLWAPAAWATPGASFDNQTIPTKTPTGSPVAPPTVVLPGDTPVPGATVTPAPTGGVPPASGTAAPGGSAGGASTGACANLSTLTLVADRSMVAPGMTVVFTATLTNTGSQALRQIALDNTLPAGFERPQLVSGQGAWQTSTLRTTAATLAPKAKLTVEYSAVVGAQPGPALTVRSSVTTAGCPAKTARVDLALPPSELPRTGGSLD